MIINRLQMDLYFFNKEGLQWILPQNSVAISSNIHVSIKFAFVFLSIEKQTDKVSGTFFAYH